MIHVSSETDNFGTRWEPVGMTLIAASLWRGVGAVVWILLKAVFYLLLMTHCYKPPALRNLQTRLYQDSRRVLRDQRG